MKSTQEQKLFFYKKAIDIPIYFGKFIIIFSNDENRICKFVNTDPSSLRYIYAHTFSGFGYEDKEAYCVVLNFWSGTPISMGVITHEVTHVGNYILDARGFDPSWNNDEAEAYLKGWLGDEIGKFMSEKHMTLD